MDFILVRCYCVALALGARHLMNASETAAHWFIYELAGVCCPMCGALSLEFCDDSICCDALGCYAVFDPEFDRKLSGGDDEEQDDEYETRPIEQRRE
jgi:hypothetical protein